LQAPNLRTPSSSARIEAWDRDYYSGCLPFPSFPNSTSSRPLTLSLGTVFQSLSEFFAQVFGLRLRVVDISPGETWHPDVHKLEVFSVDNGDAMGWIFADLYARAGKQAGAAHYTVRCSRRLDKDDWPGDLRYSEPDPNPASLGVRVTHAGDTATTMAPRRVKGKDGVYQLPIAVLSCDFSKPTLRDGASMLRWHDIETLFHEMGHALHCKYIRLLIISRTTD
jgi:intermediate peptidase